jgi:hypothetical protein
MERLDHLFAQFLREKEYLDNVFHRTLKAFGDCHSAWKRTVGEALPAGANVKEFVIGLQRDPSQELTSAPRL